MWYIVVVFFNSGLVTGPAHFEEHWYPRPVGEALINCQIVGNSVVNFLNTAQANLNGEAFAVACINASSLEELSDLVRDKWTFEDAPEPVLSLPKQPV